jgi:hypothetical protein
MGLAGASVTKGMKMMRRKDRAITEEEAAALLRRGEYGVLSTVSEDGKPYGVPVHYCLVDHDIYFHCAIKGRKVDHFEKNKSVSFCVVGDTELLPREFATRYESVIVAGEIEEVFDPRKQTALEGLVQKYSPDFFASGLKYIERFRDKTRVFKITIQTLSGKARR